MTRMSIGEGWVGHTVDERFPLLRWLGGGAECGVFLTERPGGNGDQAVLKLMPVEVAVAERRAESWDAARELEHPHLLRVYEHGRCQMDGAEFAYVVTEYAPEVLAEILPERALSGEESRAVLEPLLDALAYLHSKGLVHGHVKPANLLAQGDVLKLTADHLLRAGAATAATDVWMLGATVVEMLTQKPPAAGPNGGLATPEGLPEPFAGIARACLRVNPAERCGLAEVRERLKGEFTEQAVAPQVTVARETPDAVEAQRQPADAPLPEPVNRSRPRHGAMRWVWLSGLAVLVGVIVVVAFLLWPRSVGKRATGEGPGVNTSGGATTTVASAPVTVKGVVARRVPPEVLQSALETIYGTVRVDVRVTAGTGGRVIAAEFAEHGPSRYFAKAAMAAAKQWVFRPAQVHGRDVRSVWLLKFGFTRDGSQVTATEVSP